MTLYTDGSDNIIFFQGDSGSVTFTGFNTSTNYDVYFSLYDPCTQQEVEGSELHVQSNNQANVVFTFTSDYTKAIPLKQGCMNCTRYNYGVKICYGTSEDTLIPAVEIDESGQITAKTAPQVIIYPQRVEGNATPATVENINLSEF